jgi:anti-anti-sigma factor
MDSSGIGFLLGTFKLCNRFGVAVYIKSPNAAADKILEMSGVYALIPKLGGERRTV